MIRCNDTSATDIFADTPFVDEKYHPHARLAVSHEDSQSTYCIHACVFRHVTGRRGNQTKAAQLAYLLYQKDQNPILQLCTAVLEYFSYACCMTYESIDQIQKALAASVFSDRDSKKKAAGRALGTVLEIITFYLIRDYGLENNTAIEQSLTEYANEEIGHNVEFTLHGSKKLGKVYEEDGVLSSKNISDSLNLDYDDLFLKKSEFAVKKDIVRNASIVFDAPKAPHMVVAYPNSEDNSADVYELKTSPFAMFECKRVGVEEGMKKGPQSIEKAKQGAYVALAASKLQKIRRSDGTQLGVWEKPDGSFEIKEYDSLLEQIIMQSQLDGLVVTVGVISDHGNWFSALVQNKETKVLASAYDWLLFLTDKGLSEFIEDALLGKDPSMSETRQAFIASTNKDKKSGQSVTFTKKKLLKAADAELTRYFRDNRDRIASWFNVITPQGGTIGQMFEQLKLISAKEQIV